MENKDIEKLRKELNSKNIQEQLIAIKEIGNKYITCLSSELYELYVTQISKTNNSELKYNSLDTLGKLNCILIMPEMEVLLQENAPNKIITKAAALNYVRFNKKNDEDVEVMLELLRYGNAAICSGALSAIRKDNMILSDKTFGQILEIIMNERVDFFEKYKPIDPRVDLVLAYKAWIHLETMLVQSFIDWCAHDDLLSHLEPIILYKKSNNKLGSYLVKIEVYSQEHDNQNTFRQTLLCIDTLLDLVDLSLTNLESEYIESCRKRKIQALDEKHPEVALSLILNELEDVKTQKSLNYLGDKIFEILIFSFKYPTDKDGWGKYSYLNFFVDFLIDVEVNKSDIERTIELCFSDIINKEVN